LNEIKSFTVRRLLHKAFNHHYYPSVYYCVDEMRHVQRNHTGKHRVISFGVNNLGKRKVTSKVSFLKDSSVPSLVDLRPTLLNGEFKVFDQGQQASCTANCGSADKAYDEIVRGDYPSPFSRAFLYYQERVIEGSTDGDNGANMETIGLALAKYGVCLDNMMPYNDQDYSTTPNSNDYSNALSWVSAPTQQQLTVDQVKATLYQSQYPVRFGTPIPKSYVSNIGGWIPVPKKKEEILGGHALLIVGYNDALSDPNGNNAGYYIILNSWGLQEGDQGFDYVPYEFMNIYASQIEFWQQLNRP